MKAVLVTDATPNSRDSTVTQETLLVVERLVSAGHQVRVVVATPSLAMEQESDRRRLEEIGVTVDFWVDPRLMRTRGIHHRLRELFARNARQMWPFTSTAAEFRAFVTASRPDAIYVFSTYDVLLSFKFWDGPPAILIAGDPPFDSIRHAAMTRRSNMTHYRRLVDLRGAVNLTVAWNMKRILSREGKNLPPVGFHDLRDVRWAESVGWVAPEFAYPEVPDWGESGESISNQRRNSERSDEQGSLRLVMFGQLGGQATLSGVHYLASRFLPILSEADKSLFSLDIIGKGVEHVPPVTRECLEGSNVRFRGFVTDLRSALLDYDAVFLPIPSTKGGRPRVVYAWSLGIPVIGLDTLQGPIPGIVSGETVLTATNAEGLLSILRLVHQDRRLLRDLANAGRREFERNYADGWASKRLLNALRSLDNTARGTTSDDCHD